MYNRAWHHALSQKLAREDEKEELKGRYALILQVELVLYLLERLRIGQALRAVWFLFSGLPIPVFATRFTAEEQRLIARARIYSPYSGRFRWETDLRQYMKVPVGWRAYSVKQGKIGRTGNGVERFDVFERTLATPIPERLHHQKMAMADEHVIFEIFRRAGAKKLVDVHITPDIARVGTVPVAWFTAPRQREECILLEKRTLIDIAQHMTALEQHSLQAQGEQGLGTDWGTLAQNIHFRKRACDGSLGEVDKEPIILNGYVHLPGTISAGKTTLMKFIAFQATQQHWRVTLVVGDVMTALELADFFDSLLCGEHDPPVAVPLLGRTTLNKNLSRLCNAASYQQRRRHRAFRYLHIACLLLNEWPSTVPEAFPLGQEPCQRLILAPSKDEEEVELPEEMDQPPLKKVVRTCPLFPICPMQQAYRDLFQAPIWITTPGALSSMTVPPQLDRRQIKLWELIYEQSTLVCVDEADAVQSWFDRICAPEIILINKNGILDRIDPRVSVAWAMRRVLEPESSRWVLAERHATAVTSSLLTQLEHYGLLKRWVHHTYFTAYSLFFHLACLFSGIQEPKMIFEFDASADDDDQVSTIFPKNRNITLSNKRFTTIMGWFYQVMESDPQKAPLPGHQQKNPVQQLLQIREHILVRGSCSEEAKTWITTYIPSIRSLLKKRQSVSHSVQRHQPSRGPSGVQETVDTLALKLDFALMVSVLDAEMQVMYDEWHSGLIDIAEEYRFEHAPRHLLGLLPVPPTGSLFGFYHHSTDSPKERDPREDEPQNNPCLEVFAYSLVGRTFLTQFHQLRAAIDERPGPHVLALSGTSWLPHSSLWHIAGAPIGLLEPDEAAKRAIAKSTFTFLPQYEEERGQEKPIFVSGTPMMLANLQKIARSLIDEKHPYLRQEINLLRQREEDENGADPPQWKNRARLLLLVNSYDQVHVVAQEIARAAEWSGQVYGLKRGNEVMEDYWVEVSGWYKPWYRSDFETFGASEGGTILVAPMQAIGRGYNALNEQKIAAFGAIYFLTRPMPHPFDTQAQASEMNKTVQDWCDNPKHRLWRYKNLAHMAVALRRQAYQLWYEMDHRYGYRTLSVEKQKDLAATTAGLVMQACGRLVRGGVPFDAYFVDAAWAPRRARKLKSKDTPRNSLLAAVIAVLLDYAKDPIGDVLLGPFVQALKKINNFPYSISWRKR